jgi:hypothetical protein
MSPKIQALQRWLNLKGLAPPLIEDGVPGARTRQGIFDLFRNRSAAAVTVSDIDQFAARLGCSPIQIRAVAAVESSGGGWDNDGLLKCLYERHYGWKRFQILNPLLSNPAPGGYTVDANDNDVNDSWEKVADAALTFREPAKAFECASWGKFQIMGAWWKELDYSSAPEFVWLLSRDETAHYEAFVRFIETFGLIDALRRVDQNPMNCLAFARGYNGKGQKGYDGRIAAAFRKLS